jgi:FG-GAP repeat
MGRGNPRTRDTQRILCCCLVMTGLATASPARADCTGSALGWPLVASFYNPDPTAQDGFGHSVAVSDSIAVVGAFNDDPGGVSDAGTSYVFDTTTGKLAATLNNPDPGTGDAFGWSVAVSGNIAVIGAPLDDPGGATDAGTAYVFDTATGKLVATLNNPEPARKGNDGFGYSVAVSGNIAVIGAPGDDPGGVVDAGTAYVFDTTTGKLTATLNSPHPGTGDGFGFSVAVSGNAIVISAPLDNHRGTSHVGTVYVFNAVTGKLIITIHNPDPVAGAYFGWSVAANGHIAVIGAPNNSSGGAHYAGMAYVFDSRCGERPSDGHPE